MSELGSFYKKRIAEGLGQSERKNVFKEYAEREAIKKIEEKRELQMESTGKRQSILEVLKTDDTPEEKEKAIEKILGVSGAKTGSEIANVVSSWEKTGNPRSRRMSLAILMSVAEGEKRHNDLEEMEQSFKRQEYESVDDGKKIRKQEKEPSANVAPASTNNKDKSPISAQSLLLDMEDLKEKMKQLW